MLAIKDIISLSLGRWQPVSATALQVDARSVIAITFKRTPQICHIAENRKITTAADVHATYI